MQRRFNTKVMIVDDEQVVRDGLVDILTTKKSTNDKLRNAATSLFGQNGAPRKSISNILELQVHAVSSGEKGIEIARKAVEQGEPFAAVFLDMRMPGMDGMETAKELRRIDNKIEILFLTAYSDYSVEELNEELGVDISYFCKPFSPDEVKQLAVKSIYDWNRLRDLERLLEVITSLKVESPIVSQVLENILQQLNSMVGARSAKLYSGLSDNSLVEQLFTGIEEDSQTLDTNSKLLVELEDGDVKKGEKTLKIRIKNYGIVIVMHEDTLSINNNRLYLLRLFTQQAGQVLENIRLKLDLASTERLAGLGQAISEVAHDLRSPMSVVQSAVDYLRDDDSPEMKQEILDMMEQSAKDFFGVVEDILEFSKGRTMHPEMFGAKSYFSMLETKYLLVLRDKHVDFHLESDIDEENVNWDQSKLGRAFSNLINNSVDALLKYSKQTKPEIILKITSKGDSLEVSIADNGPGLPEDIKDKIFEPFATSGKIGGTGLGCAIAKRYVEAHLGTITVNSSSGNGTEFLMSIPKNPKFSFKAA